MVWLLHLGLCRLFDIPSSATTPAGERFAPQVFPCLKKMPATIWHLFYYRLIFLCYNVSPLIFKIILSILYNRRKFVY